MSFELRFLPEAEDTFDELVAQLHERWGERFVAKFEAKVLRALTTISESPFIYPVVEENTGIRKCILHKNCSMIYHVKDDVVEIICFWDNRQNPLIS